MKVICWFLGLLQILWGILYLESLGTDRQRHPSLVFAHLFNCFPFDFLPSHSAPDIHAALQFQGIAFH